MAALVGVLRPGLREELRLQWQEAASPVKIWGRASRQRGQLLTKPPGQQAVWLWLWAESEGAAVAHEQLGLAAVDSPDLDHQEVGAIWRGSKTVSYNQI